MKGSMSNADNLFITRWQDQIFPAINNSGGDPQDMTDLTHEQLKQFHAQNYHPSNAKLFTYGSMPLAEHLKEIGPQLDRFSKADPDNAPKLPVSLSGGSKYVTIQGPADPIYPKDEQYKASVSWLMCDTSDVLETFSLGIISSLLLDGFSAPLYQNTIEIGWGASYTANTGFDTSGRVGIFSVGLNGLRKHDVARLNNGLTNTLGHVRRTGFDKGKVEGRLHQLELGLKHKTAHFGMGLMSRLQDGWFNGVDPLTTVDPEQVVSAFKEKYAEPGYLEGLFETYWLNQETFTFVMEPSTEYGNELVAEEATRLENKIAEVTAKFGTADAARDHLEAQEAELLEIQENAKNEDVNVLPTVHVVDIPRQLERKPTRLTTVADSSVQWREAPTNGLTYFRAINTFKDLPDELRIYLPLFSAAIQRLGTRTMSIEQLEDLIKLKTGGVSVGHHSSTSPLDLDVYEDGIAFSGSAFDRNIPDMYRILQLMIQETDFDQRGSEEKIMELIKSSASNAINDVADSGSRYAQRFAEAGISPQSRLNEEVDGLTQVRLMMDLAARPERTGLGDVVDKLKLIQSFVLASTSSLRVALTCGHESSSANESALTSFLSSLPSSASVPTADSQMPYPRDVKAFFPLPYQVYYTASALRTVPYTHTASAPLQILAELLTHKRLHHEIREKGGAYGASAYAAGLRGIFGFSSYRDPNPLNSLKVMNDVGGWARDRSWSERDIEEAKLSVFQSLDAPRSVSGEGMTRFLTGVTEDMQQERRERLLDVTAKNVTEVAEAYLTRNIEERNTAVLGKKQDWVDESFIEMPMGAGEAPSVEGQEDGGGYLVL